MGGGDGGSGTGGGTGGGNGSSTIPAGPGHASLTGGLQFTVASARAMSDYGTSRGRIEVDMVDSSALVCERTPATPAEIVTLYLIKPTAEIQAGQVYGPGTYAITPFSLGSGGMVSVLRSRYTGFNDFLGIASSGSVTLTTVDPTGIAGTFDAQMGLPDGGTSALSGTFEAPSCP